MSNFSIELAADKIYDSRTKEYFQEVLSSYTNGNYRSAVVMLWTVVVCDLIYKLQALRDIYNDATAQSIINHIEQQQKDNPKSSEWEVKLLEQVKTRTELLDNAEEQNLQNLHKNRHLSAHPVLDQADLLFRPNRETARALSRNTLEGVFMKPPILGKKIVNEFVTDLAAKKDLLPDDKSLKRYLEAKYFQNLGSAVEDYLFRALWKFVFQISNSNTDENRDINFRSLKIIYARRSNELKAYIQEHKDFFSKVVSEDEPLSYLIKFLSDNPSIYSLLNDNARVIIHNYAESDIDLYAIAIFLNDDVKKHLDQIWQRFTAGEVTMSPESWRKVMEITDEHNYKKFTESVVSIGVEQYCNSTSYKLANEGFSILIEPQLKFFDREHLINLLDHIESNDQAYGRRPATKDHVKIKKKCDQVLGLQFDYSKYPNFTRSIS